MSDRLNEARRAAEEAGKIARVTPQEVEEFKTKLLPLEVETGYTPPLVVSREIKKEKRIGGAESFSIGF